jgi:hypothetical protein
MYIVTEVLIKKQISIPGLHLTVKTTCAGSHSYSFMCIFPPAW